MRSDADELIDRYCKMARPIMLKFMHPNGCIGAVRATVTAMRTLGLAARPLAVAYAFQVPSRQYARIAGFPPEEHERMKKSARSWSDLEVKDGWNGHMVAIVEERWILDPSIDQATSEEYGVHVPAEVLALDTKQENYDLRQKFEVEMNGVLDNGDPLTLRYFSKPEDTSFETTEAWNDIGADFLGAEIARRVAEEARA